MKKRKIYVCGRCGTRAHSKIVCHRCVIHLEEQCPKCFSAKSNCVCKIHGKKIKHKMVKLVHNKVK